MIIIVAGVIMYKHLYAEPREEKAQAALFKGQELFEQDNFTQALNGDSIGYTGFLKVAEQFSGTKAANLAKAYAGLCYAQLGQYDEAIKYLTEFDGKDQMVGPAVLAAAGNCYAQKNELDKAVAALLKAADKHIDACQDFESLETLLRLLHRFFIHMTYWIDLILPWAKLSSVYDESTSKLTF